MNLPLLGYEDTKLTNVLHYTEVKRHCWPSLVSSSVAGYSPIWISYEITEIQFVMLQIEIR